MVEFGSLNSRLKVRTVVQNVTVIVLLKLMDILMTPLFTCPCTNLRSSLVCLYFVGPSLAVTALTVSLSKKGVFGTMACGGCCMGGAGCSRRCVSPILWRKTIMSLYPALCWVTILFIDGKYYACLHFTVCSNISTVDMKSAEGVKLQAQSQILGFGLVILVSTLSLCFYVYECSCSSPEDRYKQLLTRKLEKAKELYIKGYAKEHCKKTLLQCESLLPPHPHSQGDIVSILEMACSAFFTSETKMNLPFTKTLILTLIRNPLPSIHIALSLSSPKISKPVSDPDSAIPLQTINYKDTLSLPLNQPMSPTLTLTECSGAFTLILTLIPEAVLALPVTFNKPATYSLIVTSASELQLISTMTCCLPNPVYSMTLPLPFKHPQPLTLFSSNNNNLTLCPNTLLTNSQNHFVEWS